MFNNVNETENFSYLAIAKLCLLEYLKISKLCNNKMRNKIKGNKTQVMKTYICIINIIIFQLHIKKSVNKYNKN